MNTWESYITSNCMCRPYSDMSEQRQHEQWLSKYLGTHVTPHIIKCKESAGSFVTCFLVECEWNQSAGSVCRPSTRGGPESEGILYAKWILC